MHSFGFCRPVVSLVYIHLFFFVFCTFRHAFNMKGQQARTGRSWQDEKDAKDDVGFALPCQTIKALARTMGKVLNAVNVGFFKLQVAGRAETASANAMA